MRLAVTVWNQRIAPVFDSAGTAIVLDLRGGICHDRTAIALSGSDLMDRARILREHAVDELVCGAMSCESEAIIRGEGIAVHPFVAGDAERVVRAWLENELDREEFSMPGCACARRRRGGRRGRGRGRSSDGPTR